MFASSMFSKVDRELAVIFGLSICVMLVVTTDNTLQNMQKTVVSSIADDVPGLNVEGYTIAGIKFSLSCVFLWFSPYINYTLGPRFTMSLAALGYLIHTASFITEDTLVIYTGTVLVALAEAAFWPAEGRYLIENSSPENLNRNMAITTFLIKFAYVLGNIFVYYSFHGLMYLDRSSRNLALWCLTALHVMAVLSYAVLPRSAVQVKEEVLVIKTVTKCWNMLWSPQMLWLSMSFCYNGLQMTFWQGVYSPSIGFTLAFGSAVKELVGLSGIFMSFGGVIGCVVPLVFSDWMRHNNYARCTLIAIGAMAQTIAYVISILIMPKTAVFGNTTDQGPFPPNLPLAMLGSALLSFGDVCLFIQTVSILGDMYRDSGAEAISLCRFVMSISSAVSYFWSNHINLYVNAGICSVMAVFNVIGFFMADRIYITQKEINADKQENHTGAKLDSEAASDENKRSHTSEVKPGEVTSLTKSMTEVTKKLH